MKKIIFIFLCQLSLMSLEAQNRDVSFLQPVSVKYHISEDLAGSVLKKVVVDYNDNIYVLSNKGLGKVQGNEVLKNLLYRPLAKKIPVDITIQEGTGDLYYLFDSCFLSNTDAGKPFGTLPVGQFSKIAVSLDSNVLLAGKNMLAVFKDDKLHFIKTTENDPVAIQAYGNTFYILYDDGVYQLDGYHLKLICKGNGLNTFAFRKNTILLGTGDGYYGVNIKTGDTSLFLQTKIPVENIQEIKFLNNHLWAATDDGAFMKMRDSGFRYFASKRWLNEDDVVSMSADSKGNIFLLTPSGLNEIRFLPITYLEKAKYFQQQIRKRHIRYGLLAEVRMSKPGDLFTAEMTDTDNDGLWTSFYLGSQAFRYAVTQNPLARRYCWESFAAYERLVSITSVKGLPARTFERTGYKVSDPSAWRPSPDSGWEWKGTTSSDEFVGHIFVTAVMDEFVAKTKTEKKRVADFIDKILTHILTHNLNFVDTNGKPTLWGRWNPKYINWYPETIGDRKLGSTTIIAGLQLGYALTHKAVYKKEAEKLLYQNGYLKNIMIDINKIKDTPGYIYKGINMGCCGANYSDDEMYFLTYWVLYHYAFNQELQKKYAQAIKNYWEILLPGKNPLWNLITLGTQGSFDRPSTLWYLREFPMDQIRWTIDNSKRKDITFREPGFRREYTTQILSPEEQPIHRYNANPFELKGGDGGSTELTGAEYLLPYWMARYLKVIR